MKGTRVKSKGGVLSKDILCYVAGSVVYAMSVQVFTAPNKIAPGGVTGLSTVLNYLMPALPIGITAFVLNIPLFIWGVLDIGPRLIAKTFLGTLSTSVAIDFIGRFARPYQGDPMLAAIFGGVLEGIGLSLIFMRGGTTGGTDLTARLLGRHFRHISMGKLMLGIDMVIVAISAVAFQSMESGLYAGITIFVSTRLIDAILYGTDVGTGKVLFIVSWKNEEIAHEILTDLDRGVTVLKSRGGYSGRDGEVLLCAVRRYEVSKVSDIVHQVDPNAFMIVGEAGEISGEGFRENRVQEKPLKEILEKSKSKRKKHQ